MYCPRCSKVEKKKVKMKQVKRKGGFHKQTKFTCPDCGLNKMKANKQSRKGKKTKFDS